MTAAEFKRAYDRGFIDGMTAYAYMRDGVIYVGTTGRSLERAVEQMEYTYNYNPTPEPTDEPAPTSTTRAKQSYVRRLSAERRGE